MMNFSGVSRQTVVGKLLRLPLRLIPNGMAVPVLQGPLRGKRWLAGSSTHGCWLGSYEYEKQRFFAKEIRANTVVFDIGANVGFYTLLASVLVGPEGQVIAFEPVPRNIDFLRKHVRLNRIDNVEIMEVAVSDAFGVATFDLGPDSSQGRIAKGGELNVQTVCLDGLISAGEKPVPDYLKIDVEGAEMSVLTGAQNLLKGAHPAIFLATHSPALHQQCLAFLRSLGYTVQAVDGQPIEKTDELFAQYV